MPWYHDGLNEYYIPRDSPAYKSWLARLLGQHAGGNVNEKIYLLIAVTRDPTDPNEVCFRVEDGHGNLAPPPPTPEIRAWVEQLTIDAIHGVNANSRPAMDASLFHNLTILIDQVAQRRPNPGVVLLPTRNDWHRDKHARVYWSD